MLYDAAISHRCKCNTLAFQIRQCDPQQLTTASEVPHTNAACCASSKHLAIACRKSKAIDSLRMSCLNQLLRQPVWRMQH